MRETVSKLGAQAFCQLLEQLLTVLRTFIALLFKLNNVPPNFEVGVYLYQINTTSNRAAGGLDQRANVATCSI